MTGDPTVDHLAAIDDAIRSLERDEAAFAIFTVDSARNWFAQVTPVADGRDRALYGEIVGNRFLAPANQLRDDVIGRLAALGWAVRPDANRVGMLSKTWPDWVGVHRRLVVDDLAGAMMTAFGLAAMDRLEIRVDS